MKILLINDSSKEVGGAETYIFGIKKILNKTQSVSLFSFGDIDYKGKNLNIVSHSQNNLIKSFEKFIFNFRVYIRLKKELIKNKPDIIWVHNNFLYSIPILLAIKNSKIPAIQTIHDWGLICPSSWSVNKKTLKKCQGVEGISWSCTKTGCISKKHFFATYFRNKIRIKLTRKTFKEFISPSKMLAEDMENHNIKPIQCIHNFMELSNQKINFSEAVDGRILYLGLIAKNKGVDYLIRSFKKIKEEYPKASLRIIGDGPNLNEFKQLAKELNLDIDFAGRIPHYKVFEEFKQAKVFVLPSIWMENSPFVIYEAMSMARPVVGSNRGGIPDLVVDKATGFLTAPGDIENLANAILKILKNDKLFEKFGEEANNRVNKKLNSNIHLEQIEKKLREVANATNNKR
jgi:glycosyltransferase involved in cell wall biosynthesis